MNDIIEEAVFISIIHGLCQPRASAYNQGYEDWKDGVPFGPGRYEMASVDGLSWRIGWNDAALGKTNATKEIN